MQEPNQALARLKLDWPPRLRRLLLVKAWRIIKQKHARTAFSREGARLYGGRWIAQEFPWSM